MFAPSRVCRKNTGPSDSRLIRIAAKRNSGEVISSRMTAPTMSITRFARSDELDRRAGGTVSSGSPSIRWTSARGPTSS